MTTQKKTLLLSIPQELPRIDDKQCMKIDDDQNIGTSDSIEAKEFCIGKIQNIL